MRTWVRRASVSVCAALVLAAAVATASAVRLQTSSQQFRAAWSQVGFTAGIAGTIRCALTLEGSFHTRSFAKTSGALLGYITRAAMASPCTNGELHVLSETLPWHVRYDSFAGTLPRFTSIRFALIGFSIWFRLLEVRCLYRSTEAAPLYVTWFRGEPSPFPEFPEFETPPSFRLEGSLFESQRGTCLETLRLEGTTRLTNLGSSTLVTITLM
jgi:hypothetical protein